MQLACARIGAVHSVVFAGFSAESLAGRILDSKPSVVLTASAVKRGAKPIDLKVLLPHPALAPLIDLLMGKGQPSGPAGLPLTATEAASLQHLAPVLCYPIGQAWLASL